MWRAPPPRRGPVSRRSTSFSSRLDHPCSITHPTQFPPPCTPVHQPPSPTSAYTRLPASSSASAPTLSDCTCSPFPAAGHTRQRLTSPPTPPTAPLPTRPRWLAPHHSFQRQYDRGRGRQTRRLLHITSAQRAGPQWPRQRVRARTGPATKGAIGLQPSCFHQSPAGDGQPRAGPGQDPARFPPARLELH